MSFYGIEWTKNARSSADAMAERLPRLKECIKGMEWGLKRKPYIYPKLAGTDLRCVPLGPLLEESAHESFKIQVYFTFDGKTCSIRYLESLSYG
jgi:hypothetical protein